LFISILDTSIVVCFKVSSHITSRISTNSISSS